MAYILNDEFEDWNFGTSFTNAATGTQLADNWYADGAIFSITQEPGTIGTYLLQTGNDVSTLGKGIYQDFSVTNAVSLTVDYAMYSNVSAPFSSFEIILNDGVTDYSSGTIMLTSNAIPSVGSVTIPFNPLATTCRMRMLKLNPAGLAWEQVVVTANKALELEDEVTMDDTLASILNHLFRLALTDAMALVEEFDPPKFNIKGFTEVVRIQDWLRKRRRVAQNRWTN